jgi:GAF domain-containing protein
MTMKEDIETLKQKLAQKERELEIILAIDRIRDGTTEMQELLSSIVQVVTHYLDADLCLMSLVREESGELELKMVDDRRGIFGQLSRDALRKAAEQGTAIDHVSILDDTFGLHQQGVNHLLAAPLVIGGERLGSLLLLNKQRGFDQDDIDLLEAVVSQTDSAVVHVRTYRQLQQRNKELETIYRIDRIRDSGLEFQPMLNVALNELCQVITAEVGFIMLFDETGQQLELKASTESDIFAIVEYYRLVQETANESLWKARLINRRDLDPRIRSIICIPLILLSRAWRSASSARLLSAPWAHRSWRRSWPLAEISSRVRGHRSPSSSLICAASPASLSARKLRAWSLSCTSTWRP